MIAYFKPFNIREKGIILDSFYVEVKLGFFQRKVAICH